MMHYLFIDLIFLLLLIVACIVISDKKGFSIKLFSTALGVMTMFIFPADCISTVIEMFGIQSIPRIYVTLIWTSFVCIVLKLCDTGFFFNNNHVIVKGIIKKMFSNPELVYVTLDKTLTISHHFSGDDANSTFQCNPKQFDLYNRLLLERAIRHWITKHPYRMYGK